MWDRIGAIPKKEAAVALSAHKYLEDDCAAKVPLLVTQTKTFNHTRSHFKVRVRPPTND